MAKKKVAKKKVEKREVPFLSRGLTLRPETEDEKHRRHQSTLVLLATFLEDEKRKKQERGWRGRGKPIAG